MKTNQEKCSIFTDLLMDHIKWTIVLNADVMRYKDMQLNENKPDSPPTISSMKWFISLWYFKRLLNNCGYIEIFCAAIVYASNIGLRIVYG